MCVGFIALTSFLGDFLGAGSTYIIPVVNTVPYELVFILPWSSTSACHFFPDGRPVSRKSDDSERPLLFLFLFFFSDLIIFLGRIQFYWN
jgi:hypothetical protein